MNCAATEQRHCTGDLRCARLGSQKMKRRIVCKWVYPVNEAVGCTQLEISRNVSMYFHFSCLIYLATFAFTTFHILLQGISCSVIFRLSWMNAACANSSPAQWQSGCLSSLGPMFAFLFTFLSFTLFLFAVRFISIIFYLHFNAQFPARFGQSSGLARPKR